MGFKRAPNGPVKTRLRSIYLDPESNRMLEEMNTSTSVSYWVRALICQEYGRRQMQREIADRERRNA